jgi:arginyl-tRNA synthetase
MYIVEAPITLQFKDMSTLTVDGLEALLSGLGLDIPIPSFPESGVLNKPLDISRSYFADILCSLLQCDPDVAYSSIQWPGDIFSGDLTVILPKLNHNGDADVIALDLMQRVCSSLCFLPRSS